MKKNIFPIVTESSNFYISPGNNKKGNRNRKIQFLKLYQINCLLTFVPKMFLKETFLMENFISEIVCYAFSLQTLDLFAFIYICDM